MTAAEREHPDVAAMTRKWPGDPDIEFYRQPGGCIEIHQFDQTADTQDIVHLCTDNAGTEIESFVAALLAFSREVKGWPTLADPLHARGDG